MSSCRIRFKIIVTKEYVYLEQDYEFEQGQKVRWPENLARVGVGMWGKALNFLELRNAFFVFRFCVKTKMKACPAGQYFL